MRDVLSFFGAGAFAKSREASGEPIKYGRLVGGHRRKLGYNTAIEDAVNLGWKLASVVKGVSQTALLDSYELERRPVALRNTDHARRFADSLGLFAAAPEIEDATETGSEARRVAGAYLDRHARSEFNIPGITFGGRYDGSPIIISDGSRPPPDAANVYAPSACPGGRAPHAWLDDGVSLYDLFGFECQAIANSIHHQWIATAFEPRPYPVRDLHRLLIRVAPFADIDYGGHARRFVRL